MCSPVRRLLIVLFLLGVAAPVGADGSGSAAPNGPIRLDPVKQIERQRLDEKEGRAGRSGFWTSRQPAKGGAYRWRMLGIGLGFMAITGGGIVLLVRRANRANAERQAKEREKRDAEAKAKPAADPAKPAADPAKPAADDAA
jgi:hypothetical protein